MMLSAGPAVADKYMPPDTMTDNQIHAEKNMLHSWQG